ncbi:hypothetical protein K8R66_03150 [bacterium]|nr:hypothetical protein [bacterium]
MEILSAEESRNCKKCGKSSDTLVDGFCLDCYDVGDLEVVVENFDNNCIDDKYEDIQKQYDKDIDKEKTKEEMIIHGQGIKNLDQQKISRDRIISKISKIKKKK